MTDRRTENQFTKLVALATVLFLLNSLCVINAQKPYNPAQPFPKKGYRLQAKSYRNIELHKFEDNDTLYYLKYNPTRELHNFTFAVITKDVKDTILSNTDKQKYTSKERKEWLEKLLLKTKINNLSSKKSRWKYYNYKYFYDNNTFKYSVAQQVYKRFSNSGNTEVKIIDRAYLNDEKKKLMMTKKHIKFLGVELYCSQADISKVLAQNGIYIHTRIKPSLDDSKEEYSGLMKINGKSYDISVETEKDEYDRVVKIAITHKMFPAMREDLSKVYDDFCTMLGNQYEHNLHWEIIPTLYDKTRHHEYYTGINTTIIPYNEDGERYELGKYNIKNVYNQHDTAKNQIKITISDWSAEDENTKGVKTTADSIDISKIIYNAPAAYIIKDKNEVLINFTYNNNINLSARLMGPDKVDFNQLLKMRYPETITAVLNGYIAYIKKLYENKSEGLDKKYGSYKEIATENAIDRLYNQYRAELKARQDEEFLRQVITPDGRIDMEKALGLTAINAALTPEEQEYMKNNGVSTEMQLQLFKTVAKIFGNMPTTVYK